MKRETRSWLVPALMFGTALLASGCASTAGSFRALNRPAAGTMARYSALGVRVETSNGARLDLSGKGRLRDLIMRNIDSELQGRFKLIQDLSGDPGGLEAQVLITRYDKGIALLRLTLAGLGAMHIDAEVTLVDRKSNEALARYEVKKTFAWGGWYGGQTGIREIEDGFAKAVAAAIIDGKEQ